MKILVTGCEGYLGSLLGPELLRSGYDVIGLDTGYYKEGTLFRSGRTTPLTLAKDLRRVEKADLRGVEAIVHMAELSNDPIGQLAPHITYEINHAGSVRLAELARSARPRFVYTSSCSVRRGRATMRPRGHSNPQTAAICKTRAEHDGNSGERPILTYLPAQRRRRLPACGLTS
jgi:nucleoside-diphosphate-sugar epimerase